MSYDANHSSVTVSREQESTAEQQRLAYRLSYFLLPAPCLACRRPVAWPRESLGLCVDCRQLLVSAGNACSTCGREMASEHLPAGYRCGECRRSPPCLQRLEWLWRYQPPLDEVILGLKFSRLDYLGRQLGEVLGQHLATRGFEIDLMAPVPLHWLRRWRRGYDQARLIAEPAAQVLGVPLVDVLSRRRWTRPQSRISKKARAGNLKQAFEVRRKGSCSGLRVLLVDDVVTTGATLAAAAQCLLDAGARRVEAAVVARTPEMPAGE